ncbi:MAG: hypothetical protein WB778_07655 [Thermoplasmata archaeon]
MSPATQESEAIRARLTKLLAASQSLESEGIPFPSAQIRTGVEHALAAGRAAEAGALLKRGEALLAKASQDWTWVRELLRRADELRTIAEVLNVDVAHLDARVGNPRQQLRSQPLSAGSLEKAAASASLALAVLNDAIPKFCAREAQQLGVSVRQARNRGEDVTEASAAFARFLMAMQDQNLPTMAQRLGELRKTVARIPRAPVLPPLSESEEEEILLEARTLARRLQRIKTKARDAQSAARLMTQVRAALSEDRRYGTPEEEIEALWEEVDRLTRQRKNAGTGPALTTSGEPVDYKESDDDSTGDNVNAEDDEAPDAPSLYPPGETDPEYSEGLTPRVRARAAHREPP